MVFRRRAISAAIGASLLATTLAEGVIAAEPGTAASASTDAVIAGTLVDAQGRGVPGQLTLVAWPTNEVLAGLAVGDTAKVGQAGRALAGPDGSFVLRMDPDMSLSEFTASDGAVNFEALGSHNGVHTAFSFSRRLVTNASGVTSLASIDGVSAQVPNVVMRFGSAPGAMGLPAPAVAADKLPVCLTEIIATYNLRLNLIGEVYTGPHTTGDLQYLNGSSSELGVGYSASGTYGTWSWNGTQSASSTTTIDFPTQGINKRTVLQSNFGWQKSRFTCAGQISYHLRPYQFQGGTAQYTAASAPTATYCTSYLQGSVFTKDTASAQGFTNGAKVGTIIGIDLYTKTGFTTNTKIKFTFVAAGSLCGSNGYPPQAARIVGK